MLDLFLSLKFRYISFVKDEAQRTKEFCIRMAIEIHGRITASGAAVCVYFY